MNNITEIEAKKELVELTKNYNEVKLEVKELKEFKEWATSEIKSIIEDSPIFDSESKKIKRNVNRVVVGFLGGKASNAYKNNSVRQRTFMDMYGQIKRQFGISPKDSISDLKRKYVAPTIYFIKNEYRLPKVLAEDIMKANRGDVS